ncbi:TetR/AcrR family transcriptional regulator [Clostridium algidicarnis]|uniref:TetR family transcriptional regulator n=2 Tax=Clostridium algidicarnis TaxID=37659 RepID=A0A2S6FW12_9CLOT|nr:TetR/AcrR family transcriptional regulator [Clostridium algidicarnis]MBB6698602.1 TetR/AcrR family transcriptional regulator [Clostridium algidicarnis]MBU3193691.1 TetR/AcrR family transcriptional regulator [Clostridium algidicarnis]MBU3204857.1 TetR/AcrR family transcriptional regulator [Clostridium algidicarnis]MBU3213011.1 TetR/AcrR family transcriptional regulator [Clostridium algidicarnis]MBU3220492.1 TetR/AcrR family transcriptional regulator [Clostridium algidicarnis]
MQYLKDHVRNSIKEEALKEFNKKGYKGASVRSIAKNSNTSVGNIYKYFDSKEALYENLIEPVYDKVMDYINQFQKVELNDKAEDVFYQLMEKIMEIFNYNSIELSILLNKSQGSKYEHCKGTFVDFITRIVTENVSYQLSTKGKKLKDNFLIYIISNSLVESISIILEERQEGAEVRKLILSIIEIFYNDILDKVDSEDIN